MRVKNYYIHTVLGSIPGGTSPPGVTRPPGGFEGPPSDICSEDFGRWQTRWADREPRLATSGRNAGAKPPCPEDPTKESEGSSVDARAKAISSRAYLRGTRAAGILPRPSLYPVQGPTNFYSSQAR